MTAVRRWARRCRSASSAAAEESSPDSSSVWFLSNRATLLCSDPEVEDALPDIDEIPKVITVSLLNHISNASRAMADGYTPSTMLSHSSRLTTLPLAFSLTLALYRCQSLLKWVRCSSIVSNSA